MFALYVHMEQIPLLHMMPWSGFWSGVCYSHNAKQSLAHGCSSFSLLERATVVRACLQYFTHCTAYLIVLYSLGLELTPCL